MRKLVSVGFALLATSGLLFGETVALKDGAKALWRREVLPLPHELAIKQVQRLKPGEVLVKGRPGASGLEQVSVSNVVELFREKTGVVPEGKGFEILIGLIDDKGKLEGIDVPNATRLKEVPNRDQAYVIQPVGEKVLIVAALSDRGLYYGTQTLSQWLELHLTKDVAEIPLASVVDWPDLEERGFWHMPVSLVPWLASMKMNRFYVAHWFVVDNTGIRPTSTYNENDAKLRQEWTLPYEKARMYAAEVVPGPCHMDFWGDRCKGYKEAFPDVIGKGESARDLIQSGDHRVPCASNPDLVKILTVVMTNLAAQKASEVMVWMSECPVAHCECEQCLKANGQYRTEARAAVEAWKEAKKSYPDLKLSVFFGRGMPAEARYPDQEIKDIVASLPPEVTMRVSMGCDGPDGRLLADFAAKGKRIARMDVSYLPYYSMSFMSDDVRHGIEKVVSSKYIGAWTFTPGIYANTDSGKKKDNYRASALAEYEWNAKGRNAKEFAEAWACRQGFKEPAKFVAWIDAMNMPQAGRVGSFWIGDRSWFISLTNMVAQKKWDETKFKPGEPEAGIKRSEQALALAEELGSQDLIMQSRSMLAYCRLEQAGYRFISKLQDTTLEGAAKEKAVGEAFVQLKEALKQDVQARLDIATSFMPDYAVNLTKKQGAELEGELDKVSAEMANKK